MNSRRTAKITLKSSWRLAHYRAIQTCLKRSKGKIFQSNVTTIKIKVFQQLSTAVYFQNYLHKLGNKAKISLYIPLKRLFPSAKITLLISHSDWSNLVTHQVINKSNPHIQLTLVHTKTLHHNFLKRKYTRFQEVFPTVKARL